MAPFLLLLNATKVLGVAGVIGISVNSLFYRSFRENHLLPFESPINEDDEVLARFAIDADVDDGGFFFSLATAPAHVEDKLFDAWLEFAEEDTPKDEKAAGKPEICDESTEAIVISLLEEEYAAKKLEDKELKFWKDSAKKEKADVRRGSPQRSETADEAIVQSTTVNKGEDLVKEGVPELEVEFLQTPKRRQKLTTATVQFNPPRKTKKLAKVALETILDGVNKVFEAFEDSREESKNVKAWQNAFIPEERLRFWSEPDTELRLAKQANVSVYRMGVDWSRIMPVEPVNGIANAVNWDAVERYRLIIERVKFYGMKVMLTLFHHSLPAWAAKYGGWRNRKTVNYFVEFTRLVVEKYADLVDYWVTFNEPHVFAVLTYLAGAWPGGDANLLETAFSPLPYVGVFRVVMAAVADAHVQAYDIIHENGKKISKKAKVGIAHHVSFSRPYGLNDMPFVVFSNCMTRFAFIDDIIKKLDFIGINYYGQEVISIPGLKHVETEAFSESGRCIYPDGLYRVLTSFHDRYKKFNVPYIITENGVSDSTDYIRRPYIIEHLLAIKAAMIEGVPVLGYCFWTTSDNWEWADGYGPKFGLVAVDRRNNLARTPRPSFYLFGEIAKTGVVTKQQRDQAWDELQTAAAEGKKQLLFRAVDCNGLMYSGGLDVPIEFPFVDRDWRFGHYEYEGLQDPLSRFIRFILSGAFLGRRKPIRKKSRPPSRVPPLESKWPSKARIEGG